MNLEYMITAIMMKVHRRLIKSDLGGLIYTLDAEKCEKVSRFATFYVCFDSFKHKISAFWITN